MIRKNHIHLLILLFAVSSLFVHYPDVDALGTITFLNSHELTDSGDTPRYFDFNDDGTKLIITEGDDDFILEYTLSAYDLTTLSYAGDSERFDSSSSNDGDGQPRAIEFNADGTIMFVIGNAGDKIIQYALSTGYDVSTASFTQKKNIKGTDSTSAVGGAPTGMVFNADGTKVFVNNKNKVVYELDLDDPFDIKPLNKLREIDLSAHLPKSMRGMEFSDDGKKFFVITNDGTNNSRNNKIHEFTLSTAYDVSTFSYVGYFDVNPWETDPQGLGFNDDGTRMYVLGTKGIGSAEAIHEFSVTPPYSVANEIVSRYAPNSYAPHIHDEVTVSINSNEEFNLNLKDKEIPKITSRVGDTVDITISVGDDKKLDQISQIKFMTNFAKKPSGINNYFENNYNDYHQVSLSVYEWNQHKDDVKYDYGGTISWNEPSTMVQQRTLTNHDYVGPLLFGEEELIIVFSLTMNNVMDETQIITKIMDTSHMQKRSVLPFTLEVLPELTETPSVESVGEIKSPADDKSEFFIKSNKSAYENGNKVVITGQIPIQDYNPKQGKNIAFSITSPENEIILAGKFTPRLDGSFIFETFTTDSTWKTDGDYIFNFNFGSISSNLVLSYDNSQFEKVDLETRIDEKVVESVVAPSVVEEHKSTQLGIAAFVDQSKDPQHYVDRYFNESKYKQWFDKNYPQYISIYQAVGLEEPVKVIEEPVKENIVEIKTEKPEEKLPKLTIAAFVDQSKDPQHYVDRYFNESKYKQWFDKNYPQYISIYQAVGLEEPVKVIEEPVKENIVEIKIGKYISRR